MLGPAVDDDVNVTGSPAKMSPEASVRCAVTVACAEPSAASEVGVMLTVRLLGWGVLWVRLTVPSATPLAPGSDAVIVLVTTLWPTRTQKSYTPAVVVIAGWVID